MQKRYIRIYESQKSPSNSVTSKITFLSTDESGNFFSIVPGRVCMAFFSLGITCYEYAIFAPPHMNKRALFPHIYTKHTQTFSRDIPKSLTLGKTNVGVHGVTPQPPGFLRCMCRLGIIPQSYLYVADIMFLAFQLDLIYILFAMVRLRAINHSIELD